MYHEIMKNLFIFIFMVAEVAYAGGPPRTILPPLGRGSVAGSVFGRPVLSNPPLDRRENDASVAPVTSGGSVDGVRLSLGSLPPLIDKRPSSDLIAHSVLSNPPLVGRENDASVAPVTPGGRGDGETRGLSPGSLLPSVDKRPSSDLIAHADALQTDIERILREVKKEIIDSKKETSVHKVYGVGAENKNVKLQHVIDVLDRYLVEIKSASPGMKKGSSSNNLVDFVQSKIANLTKSINVLRDQIERSVHTKFKVSHGDILKQYEQELIAAQSMEAYLVSQHEAKAKNANLIFDDGATESAVRLEMPAK